MELPIDEQQAAERYEQAEGAFLAGIRTDVDRATLTGLADPVASHADTWNTIAYASFNASSGEERDRLDHMTEGTEVLASMWNDMARAFHGLAAEGY